MLFQWKCQNEISFKEVTFIPVLFFRYGLHKKLRDHYLNDPPNTNTTSDPGEVLEGDQGGQYTSIDNDDLYAEHRKLKQGQYLYPVIFEPH